MAVSLVRWNGIEALNFERKMLKEKPAFKAIANRDRGNLLSDYG